VDAWPPACRTTANTRIPQALSASRRINLTLTTHFFVIELGEYASIKTKCFPIRADERRFFNLIGSRFIDPIAGAWGNKYFKKIDALAFPWWRISSGEA
jgi:hypothetical protein